MVLVLHAQRDDVFSAVHHSGATAGPQGSRFPALVHRGAAGSRSGVVSFAPRQFRMGGVNSCSEARMASFDWQRKRGAIAGALGCGTHGDGHVFDFRR